MGTREQILDACTELIVQDGLQALSLRKVADRVGIRAPSIYQHFASKEDLLAAARAAALQALGLCMAASESGRDPRRRLATTAMGYYAFAQEHPESFALLFSAFGSGRRSLEEAPDADSPYAFLLAAVRRFLGARGEEGSEAEFLAFGIWSLVHGAAALRQTHLKDFDGPLEEGLRTNLDALLAGWRPA
jgi:AcrR family transcriptional regulator